MFKRAGCEVDVFCDNASWLLTSSYYDRWIESAYIDTQFTAQLLSLVEQNPDEYDWIVPLEDETVKLINEAVKSEWLFKKLLPITKLEDRELLSSKMGLSKTCLKYNITTPRFIKYNENEEPDLKLIASQLDFPILLKEDFSFSGIGIHYCEHIARLEESLDNVGNMSNLLLQEYIYGDDIGVEALFKDGELIMYNCARILSYMYNKFSFTTSRSYYQDERVVQSLRKLGKSVGLNGFASIQFIYHPERNLYYLIEADLRTNSWMPYSRFMGSDFSEGIRSIANGERKYIANKNPANKKFEVAIFDRDIRRCIKNKNYGSLLKWVFNYKGYWKFIPFYDRKIFKRVTQKILRDFTVKIAKNRAA
jgi:predicted ATP-grasp superfamily ATP-dependent carboligase